MGSKMCEEESVSQMSYRKLLPKCMSSCFLKSAGSRHTRSGAVVSALGLPESIRSCVSL